MTHEHRHQSPVLRNTEISEEFFETLCNIANEPNPESGVVNWTPKGVPMRKRQTVNS